MRVQILGFVSLVWCCLSLLTGPARALAQPATRGKPPAIEQAGAGGVSDVEGPAPDVSPPVESFPPAEVTEAPFTAPVPLVTSPSGPAAPAVPTTSAGVSSPAVAARAEVAIPLTMDEIPVSSASSRVTLNLFGDTAFSIDSVTPRKPAFILGPLDLLFWGQFGNLAASAELAIEPLRDGTVGLDLERSFIRWHSERFFIDAGRTHTELGYWNNAFHHGRWLQMPVERPRGVLFEDEGGILPVHSVGATVHLLALTGPQQLELIAAVGNGRGNIVDDIHAKDDTNGFKSLLFKVDLRGLGAEDLHLGLSGIFDHIAAASATLRPALPNQAINEAIANAYLAYRGTDFTGIAEAYQIFHSVPGNSWNTVDAFALLAYRLGSVTPYVLGEVRRGDIVSDPFFFPGTVATAEEPILGPFAEATAGLRWDLNAWTAVKLEYRGTFVKDGGPRIDRGIVDWSFGL